MEDMSSNPNLRKEHFAELQASGLTEEQIAVAGHFSVNKAKANELVGYKLPGLIFQYCDLDGKPFLRSDGKAFYRIKPEWGNIKTEDSPKYLSPKGHGCRPYFSRLYSNWKAVAKSTKVDLWETEGEKKGDCSCANGLATIAFSGVDGWVDRCPREGEGELKSSRVLPELSEINWQNRRVNQCFDSDIVEKIPVQLALAKRAYYLSEQGAVPYFVLLPNEIDGSKNGLDDFIVRHGIDALRVLGKEAKPTPFVLKIKDEETEEKEVFLRLTEPDSHYQAILAWSVLKENWAFRPNIGWYEWRKTHWELRSPEEFEEVLTRFMDAQNWKKRGSSLISSVVRELRSRLLVRDESWSPFGKIAFTNGTLDTVSGQFTPSHDPYDRLIKVRPYPFDLSAKCPTWLNFLNQAMEGDRERINLIQALFRYAVLPRRKDKKAEVEKSFDFFGQKGTGKGTTLDVLTNLVGSENVGSASAETFKNAVGLGQLIDKDLAIDYDASGFLKDIGAYNKVVSNEPVQVKKLYQNLATIRLGVLVVRAYNAFIPVPDGSEGLDRRLTVIPFNRSPDVVDTNLSKKLERELSGIFAWCYEISADEMKQRILSAGRIKVVQKASIERFETNNPEYRFLCEVFPNGKGSIKAGDLYKSYQQWCRENENQPKSNVKFAATIHTMKCKRSEGKINGCYYYTIPDMSKFNVAAHLGIVPRQLTDSCRDSSKPDAARDRDSCRQLELISFKTSEQLKFEYEQVEDKEKEKDFSSQPSTTVPNSVATTVTTVSTIPSSVSNLSDNIGQISDSLRVREPSPQENPFGNRTPPTTDDRVINSNPDLLVVNWQPKVGDKVKVLHNESWQPATLIAVPQSHNDPKKNCRFWQAELDTGEKRYIWNQEQIQSGED
ncbi:DUF3854 domain-containing protein [Phormidium sp. LEGE 05292]|uniref:phage/plasmid primase, P4 family n=1 Tax=[Phormidium] sp. LEGE 05292 TaxID=767427 RepID=UPI00187EE000|nr:phage/plasmid primase, P4 family [Phormidium sp. LEGE 05292]MBE9226264.1 DUF3854 domain-containing protein [Phormidium sp. LEGE 05292]